ncbi:Cj0069 family protein [Dankookia rubra]|uniref:Cj0069 family protein n=1 Tax=Dankookia rubra TaxID=1442381 RepID=UPI0019D5D759|nr:Cj0069 family protein [Dankookia rubra]
MTSTVGRVALLWRGDREARANATPENNRYYRIFEELAARGIQAEPAVYSEDTEEEVRAQLLTVDGVLVWVNPQDNGRNRHRLDAMLRDIASRGVWVSAHPDIILKMGAKEVLQRTKHLGWGTDTHVYRSAEALRAEFPRSLHGDGPRVLKRNRGDGGQGTWKVELLPEREGTVRVLEARRGSVLEEIPLENFLARCDEYFAVDGCVVDQPFQPRLPDGMIRCYVGADRVIGFGHQLIKALIPPPPEGPDSLAAQPGPRIMHPASAPQFQRLRALMEEEWTPRMMETLGIEREELPIIWDADFLYGPRTPDGEDTYVLCEINVSSVFANRTRRPRR